MIGISTRGATNSSTYYSCICMSWDEFDRAGAPDIYARDLNLFGSPSRTAVRRQVPYCCVSERFGIKPLVSTILALVTTIVGWMSRPVSALSTCGAPYLNNTPFGEAKEEEIWT